jgi:hypothetical protein
LKKLHTILQISGILAISAVIIAFFSGFEEYKDFDLNNIQIRNEIAKPYQ